MEFNTIVNGDSRDAKNYPDKPFHLTVTSPPYFVGKNYEKDYTFDDYKDLLRAVMRNTAANTVEGGKIAINIADIAAFSKVSGRVEENIEVSRDLVEWLREEDCHLMARIVWIKDPPWVNSQHVGYSDRIPPTYVRVLPSWEYIWVFYKGESPKRPDLVGHDVMEFLSKKDWKTWATGVWNIPSVHSNNFHEAMFPEEIVRRLVLLYSVPGDTVFDPFLGSGTTAAVAYKNRRDFAGIERDAEYYELCQKSMAAVENCLDRDFEPADRWRQEVIGFPKPPKKRVKD